MGHHSRSHCVYSRNAQLMAIDIPPIVAVDSMTLVWGLRQVGTEKQCRDAKWLFDQFTARKTQVILADIAVSEYLTAIDPEQHSQVVETLKKRFLLCPFTTDCASQAAKLFRAGKQLRVQGIPGGRAILRADSLIVATAKIHGAGCLYSNDNDCRELANTISSAFGRDVPEADIDLFGDPT